MIRWVSVKHRLPELHKDVLLFFDDGKEQNMVVGFLCDVYEDHTSWCAYSDCGWYTDCDSEPTHWSETPKPPKGAS